MRRARTIALYFTALAGASLLLTVLQGFTPLRWADTAFLIALPALVLSGFYYLARQKAYRELGNTMKKFLWAVMELFGGRDHTRQRQAMREERRPEEDLLRGCEAFVASAILLGLDLCFVYAFF